MSCIASLDSIKTLYNAGDHKSLLRVAKSSFSFEDINKQEYNSIYDKIYYYTCKSCMVLKLYEQCEKCIKTWIEKEKNIEAYVLLYECYKMNNKSKELEEIVEYLYQHLEKNKLWREITNEYILTTKDNNKLIDIYQTLCNNSPIEEALIYYKSFISLLESLEVSSFIIKLTSLISTKFKLKDVKLPKSTTYLTNLWNETPSSRATRISSYSSLVTTLPSDWDISLLIIKDLMSDMKDIKELKEDTKDTKEKLLVILNDIIESEHNSWNNLNNIYIKYLDIEKNSNYSYRLVMRTEIAYKLANTQIDHDKCFVNFEIACLLHSKIPNDISCDKLCMLWDDIYDKHDFKKFVYYYPNNFNLWISLLRNTEKFNYKCRLNMFKTFITDSNLVSGWCALSNLSNKLGMYNETLEFIKKGTLVIQKKNTFDIRNINHKNYLRLCAAKALYGLKRTDKAIQTIQVILNDNITASLMEECQKLYCDCLLRMKDFEALEKYCTNIDSPWAISMVAWSKCLAVCPDLLSDRFYTGMSPPLLISKPIAKPELLELPKKLIEQAIVKEPNVSIHKIRLAKIYWLLGGNFRSDKAYSFSMLMNAAKIEQTSEPFALLGHFYTIEKNYAQAVRCYQKALYLDPSDKEAGSALFAYFVTQNRLIDAQKICESAIEVSVMAGWAYLRLARIFKESLNYAKAISNFQQVLRIDSSCAIVWSELGESYYYYGKHVPSMKALTRSTEIERNVTAFTLLAKVKLILGLREEALLLINEVCSENPKFLYSKIVLSEILLSIAKFELEVCAFTSCKKTVEKAISLLLTLPKLASNLKMLGDFYNFYYYLPLEIIGDYCTKGNISKAINIKLRHLLSAAKIYSKALYLDPISATYWYDCAVAYYKCVDVISLLPHDDPARIKSEIYRMKSISCLKSCLKLCPENAVFWNALGVVLPIGHITFKQHCFIKASYLDPYSSEGVSNLGYLYLLNKSDHAQLVFDYLQKINPVDPGLWLGQGWIQRDKDLYKLSSSQFKRSIELKGSSLARLLLGDSSLILNDPNLAVLYLEQYCLLNPLCVESLNLFGLALEKQGLYENAEKVYSNVLFLNTIYSYSKEVDASVSINKARVLGLLGKVEESMKLFNNFNITLPSIFKTPLFKIQESLPVIDYNDVITNSFPFNLINTCTYEVSIYRIIASIFYSAGESDKAITAILKALSNLNEIPVNNKNRHFLSNQKFELLYAYSLLLINISEKESLELLLNLSTYDNSALLSLLCYYFLRNKVDASTLSIVNKKKQLLHLSSPEFQAAELNLYRSKSDHLISKKLIQKNIFQNPTIQSNWLLLGLWNLQHDALHFKIISKLILHVDSDFDTSELIYSFAALLNDKAPITIISKLVFRNPSPYNILLLQYAKIFLVK